MPLFLVGVNTGAHMCTYTHPDPPHLDKEISTEMTPDKHRTTMEVALWRLRPRVLTLS